VPSLDESPFKLAGKIFIPVLHHGCPIEMGKIVSSIPYRQKLRELEKDLLSGTKNGFLS
jgi:hypothetical protein